VTIFVAPTPAVAAAVFILIRSGLPVRATLTPAKTDAN